jgi:hypothetical protein
MLWAEVESMPRPLGDWWARSADSLATARQSQVGGKSRPRFTVKGAATRRL